MRATQSTRFDLAAALIGLTASIAGGGQIENMMSFQARLTDDGGEPMQGDHILHFAIYASDAGGNPIGILPDQSVTLSDDGIVSQPIGPVQDTWFNDAPRFLGITIDGGEELTPRIRLTAVPFAMRAFNMPTTTILSVASGSIAGQLDVGSHMSIGGPAPTGAGVLSLWADTPDADHGLAWHAAMGSTARAYLIPDGDNNTTFFLTRGGDQSKGLAISADGRIAFRGAPFGAGDFSILFPTMHPDHGLALLPTLGTSARAYFKDDGVDNTTFFLVRGGDDGKGISIMANGNVGINDGSPDATLDVEGTARVRILTITGGSDLAEPFAVNDVASADHRLEPGLVVVIDPDRPGELKLSSDAYDRKVAGVISGANGLAPGMVMKSEGLPMADGEHNVALTGRVWCWCDAAFGVIEPGDRLTTSGTPGHAMKVLDEALAPGAVIGKAMTPLDEGRGLVLVLVQPQ